MKKISTETAVCMTALLALHDIEQNDTEQAKRMLQFLVNRLDINYIKAMLEKRLSIGKVIY